MSGIRNADGWSTEDVACWVSREGLSHLAETMRRNGVDGATLLELTKADLREELGISGLKDRKELWGKIAELQRQGQHLPAPVSERSSCSASSSSSEDHHEAREEVDAPLPRPAPVPTPQADNVYRSEYALRYGAATQAPRIGQPYQPPRPVAISFRATAATAKRCSFCGQRFAPGSSYTELTLPGEKVPAVLHDTPKCHDGWVKNNAKPCEHCGELMASTVVTVSLPGNKKRAELHDACKEAWLEENADPCDHCGKPMTRSVVKLSGTFGTAMVHEACCKAFEAALADGNKKGTSGAAKRGGATPATRGTSPRHGVPVTSAPVGTAKCASCMRSFGPGDTPVLLKLPNSHTSVELHPACRTSYARENSAKCHHCGLPMSKSMVTLTGDFGSAQLHPECVNLFELRLRRNSGVLPRRAVRLEA